MSSNGIEIAPDDTSMGLKMTVSRQQSDNPQINRVRLQGLIRKYALRKRGLSAKANDEYRPCPYVPTPHNVLDVVLSRVSIRDDDVLVDLGCGDGRVAIAVAEHYGCQTIGIEYDDRVLSRAQHAQEALRQRNAEAALRVRFLKNNFFDPDVGSILAQATIVWLFLTPKVQKWLLPILLFNMVVGSRIVSYVFPLETAPDAVIDVSDVILGHQLTLAYVYNITGESKSWLGQHQQLTRS